MMLRQKIFRAFLQLAFGLLLAISIAAVLIHQYLKTQEELTNLKNFGHIIAEAVEKHGVSFLNNVKSNSVRVTIIDPDGDVEYDNVADVRTLDNHFNRTEVTGAFENGESSARRFSDTLKLQTYYHAIRLDDGRVLRVSFTSESIFIYTQRFTLFLIVLLAFLVLACYYIATVLSRSLIEPIDKINLNDLNSLIDPLSVTYTELKPFIYRIAEQQREIDERINLLRQKSNEFSTITKSLSDGLVLLNAKGNIVSINKTARRIFAVTKENCLNQSYLAIDNSQYMHDMMANAANKPKQIMNIVRDGRDFEVRFSKIQDNGQCIGYVLIILDVTEKKRTEQLRQEFTANVSHELKTPLQSIIGYAELMANGLVQPKDIKPFAERIFKQSSCLKTLIEDIIFLSHLDEGQVAVINEVNIKEICNEVFDHLQEKAMERMVLLTVRGPEMSFSAVPRYIYELIYNLVDNAIRYNKEHGRVNVILKETNNKYVITIQDTGIGIAHEDQFRIFERFYRVDKSHSRLTGGTGLGLSIVKRVVLFHHGKITLLSRLGEGTTFTITFYKKKLHELVLKNEKRQQELKEEAELERQRELERTSNKTSVTCDATKEVYKPTFGTNSHAHEGTASSSIESTDLTEAQAEGTDNAAKSKHVDTKFSIISPDAFNHSDDEWPDTTDQNDTKHPREIKPKFATDENGNQIMIIADGSGIDDEGADDISQDGEKDTTALSTASDDKSLSADIDHDTNAVTDNKAAKNVTKNVSAGTDVVSDTYSDKASDSYADASPDIDATRDAEATRDANADAYQDVAENKSTKASSNE